MRLILFIPAVLDPECPFDGDGGGGLGIIIRIVSSKVPMVASSPDESLLLVKGNGVSNNRFRIATLI